MVHDKNICVDISNDMKLIFSYMDWNNYLAGILKYST